MKAPASLCGAFFIRMLNIHSATREELGSYLASRGIPAYRAGQLFDWIYAKGVFQYSRMSNIPQELREKLVSLASCPSLRKIKARRSIDGTEKFLLGLSDGRCIEAVSIPAAGRVTGCISTQAGCKYRCVFCASGRGGLARDLAAAEIVEQALFLKFESRLKRLTHVVFMGTGEPLDNYENVMKAIRIIHDPRGLRIAARRITLSTSGVIPGIERLSREGLQVELSVSLHAVDQQLRARLMPVSRKYPLPELMRACREYYRGTNRQITFEYILIRGVNDDRQSSLLLPRLLQGMDAKINLISYNPVDGYGQSPASTHAVRYFKEALTKAGIPVTHRISRGADIEAACGQLMLRAKRAGSIS